jgi:hypothetical protein
MERGAAANSSATAQTSSSASSKRIDESLDSARRLAHNAVHVGVATLQELESQSELLDTSGSLMEKNEALLSQSMKVLRGMTWSGSIYNACADLSSAFSTSASTASTALAATDNNEMPVTRYGTNFPAHIASGADLSLSQQTPPQRQQQQAAQDEALDDIARALGTLQSLSVALGGQLRDQCDQLDGLDRLAERTHDHTLAVNLKTAKLAQSSSSSTSSSNTTYLGTFQFFAVAQSALLATDPVNQQLVLTSCADVSSLFRCYARHSTVVGLQSEVSGKFVGCTMFGKVAVSGEYFGSHEECWMDLTGKDSGLLFVARNWGGGGWLSFVPSPVNTVNTVNTVTADSALTTTTTTTTTTTDKAVVLSSTTTSIHDHTDWITFRAIRCK